MHADPGNIRNVRSDAPLFGHELHTQFKRQLEALEGVPHSLMPNHESAVLVTSACTFKLVNVRGKYSVDRWDEVELSKLPTTLSPPLACFGPSET